MDAEDDSSTFGRIGIGSWTYPWAVGNQVTDLRPPEPMSAKPWFEQRLSCRSESSKSLTIFPLDALTSPELKSLRQLGARLWNRTAGRNPRSRSRIICSSIFGLPKSSNQRWFGTLGGWPGYPTPLSEVEKNIHLVLPAFIDAGVSFGVRELRGLCNR